MICASVDVVVQAARLRDGSRKITHVTEVIGMEGDVIITQDIFLYEMTGEDANGNLVGEHHSTGIGRPKFWDRARYFNEEVRLAATLDAANAEAEQTGWVQPVHSPGRMKVAERRVAHRLEQGSDAQLDVGDLGGVGEPGHLLAEDADELGVLATRRVDALQVLDCRDEVGIDVERLREIPDGLVRLRHVRVEQLAELARQLEEAGLIEQRDGRLELTPRGVRKIGQRALGDLYTKLLQDRPGGHRIERAGAGHERADEHKRYEYGDPFHLDEIGRAHV